MEAHTQGVLPLVSIIMPVHNGAEYLPEALTSILSQTYEGPMELIVFDDGPSTDSSAEIVSGFRERLSRRNVALKLLTGPSGGPVGCGAGRNRAIEASSGEYLCFADADDVAMKERIECQLELARRSSNALVGANYVRLPADATPRLTQWGNALSQDQLYTQQLVETTIIAPTWFCSRSVFHTAGPFDETGPGTPDDLMFYYRHISLGGTLAKVEKPLVVYRFHGASVTGSRGVPWERIWDVRVAHLQDFLLAKLAWEDFTIWNAGKEGRRLYRSLSSANQQKVKAFCDVSAEAIQRGVYCHHASGRRVPIIHWTLAKPPFLLCVKRQLPTSTSQKNGSDDMPSFETNVASLNLQEGVDYIHFS